jgi:hypothetical protein
MRALYLLAICLFVVFLLIATAGTHTWAREKLATGLHTVWAVLTHMFPLNFLRAMWVVAAAVAMFVISTLHTGATITGMWPSLRSMLDPPKTARADPDDDATATGQTHPRTAGA